MHFAAALTLSLAALSAGPLEVGVEYRVEGRLVKLRDENGDNEKRFQLTLFADGEGDGDKPQQIYWTLTENGRGQAPWLERFGGCSPFAETPDSPALYYRRDEGLSISPLPPLGVKADADRRVGQKWSEGSRVFEIVGETKVADRACWKVVSRDAVGRSREMRIEKDTGLAVYLNQTQFLGQGERYELEWNIRRVNADSPVATAADAVRQLIAIREKSGWQRRNESASLTAEQRQAISKSIGPILKQAEGSPLASIVTAARKDLMNQAERAESIATMAKRAAGKSLLTESLDDLSGKKTPLCNGRVTVLHFWEYREKPLKDPYGQAGYVDFLYRNRDADKVDVFGVNVDSRLGINATRPASIRSAKRFRSFMNLSYPLLLDDGQLLRRLGDPRKLGAKLPLYIVLDPNGKVVAYKAGLYKVDTRVGLKELGEAIKAAARVK